MTPPERQTRARAWALYPGCVLRLVTVSDGRAAVQLTGEGGTWQTTYAPAATPAQAPTRTYADGLREARSELAELTRAVLAAADGRDIDPGAATPEHRTVALALQRMSKAVIAEAKAPAVPFDPALHVTRAEVAADLHRLSIHTDSERVECHESGNRDGAAALQRVDTCIAKVCAKYEAQS